MDFNAAPAAGPSGMNKGKGKASLAGAAADIDLPPQAHEFDLGGYGDLDDDEPMYDLGPDGALVFDLGLDDLLGMDEEEVGRGRKRSASAMTGEDDVELGRRDDGPNASDRGASVFSNNDFGGGDDFVAEKDGEQIDLGLGDDGDMGGFEQFDFGGGDEVFGDRERSAWRAFLIVRARLTRTRSQHLKRTATPRQSKTTTGQGSLPRRQRTSRPRRRSSRPGTRSKSSRSRSSTA